MKLHFEDLIFVHISIIYLSINYLSIHHLSIRLFYPPLRDLPNTQYFLSRGMLQCCHKSLHLYVVNTNFATSVWKQQIGYKPAGLADVVLNDCESCVNVSSGLLDMRSCLKQR